MSDDPDFEYLIIDSTIVRAHQHASGAKRGLKIRPSDAREAGLSTKIHRCARTGCPVGFVLTAGQKGNASQAGALLEAAPAEFVIADAAYDADHIRETAAEKGAQAVRSRYSIASSSSGWPKVFSSPGRHG